MEIAAVGASAPLSAGAPAWRREVAGAGFDVAFDRAMGAAPSAGTSNPADALVGQQLTPPPGGCQCDAMAAAAAPEGTTWRPVARETFMTGAVQPGDLLLLATDDASERLHAAIVRNLTEMIAPDGDGSIGIRPIPWGMVREVRRPG